MERRLWSAGLGWVLSKKPVRILQLCPECSPLISSLDTEPVLWHWILLGSPVHIYLWRINVPWGSAMCQQWLPIGKNLEIEDCFTYVVTSYYMEIMSHGTDLYNLDVMSTDSHFEELFCWLEEQPSPSANKGTDLKHHFTQNVVWLYQEQRVPKLKCQLLEKNIHLHHVAHTLS